MRAGDQKLRFDLVWPYKGLATRDQNNSDVISNPRYGLYAPSARLLDAQDS